LKAKTNQQPYLKPPLRSKSRVGSPIPELIAGGIYLFSVASQSAIKGTSLYNKSSDIARFRAGSILITQCFDESDEIAFKKLSEEWDLETGHFSITQQSIAHPKYLEIIGMRERALPFLISETLHGSPDWLPALRAIAGERRPIEGTTFQESVGAWRRWWSEKQSRYAGMDFAI
jgi:hypothetical protein